MNRVISVTVAGLLAASLNLPAFAAESGLEVATQRAQANAQYSAAIQQASRQEQLLLGRPASRRLCSRIGMNTQYVQQFAAEQIADGFRFCIMS